MKKIILIAFTVLSTLSANANSLEQTGKLIKKNQKKQIELVLYGPSSLLHERSKDFNSIPISFENLSKN